MKLFNTLILSSALFLLTALPTLAAGTSTSIAKKTQKQAIQECQKTALNTYLTANDKVWDTYNKSMNEAQAIYKITRPINKSKNETRTANANLKDAKDKAKEIWRMAHKVAKDTLEVDRMTCKKMR